MLKTSSRDTPCWSRTPFSVFADSVRFFKHFESFGQAVYDNSKTVISREYSTEWQDGMEPFYPINDQQNTQLYEQYKQLADQETNVIFGGRLAEYKYYDMAPIIEKVLGLAV